MSSPLQFAWVFSLGWLVALNPGHAQAARPSVDFDFGSTAECRELALPEYEGVFPGEKIVELKLRISVHLTTGNLDEVEEVRIEAVDCDRRIRVHSFEPSTQLESRVSEDIQWSRTIEKGGSLGASLGGQAPVLLGDAVAHITPSIQGRTSKREVITETQSRIAPKHAVITSGTIDGEHGVFFKLRRSSQSSLEGVHELTIRFVVPETWRGDSIRICCQATGQEKILWMKQQKTWTHRCAQVAIYLAGDVDARRAAVRFTRRSAGS
ncbi:MAG: hypothetical protein GXP28_05100 [Planctomycetes bacterium]|nr:hypothetical protein [Planctomycetota bacterium]